MSRFRWVMPIVCLVVVVLAVGCDTGSGSATSANAAGRAKVSNVNGAFTPPTIQNYTEYHNYMKAQKLYDDPSSIIWCTTTWGNASAPLFTVPVASKLTSSSVSLFPSTQNKTFEYSGTYNPELPSVDAMYHGSPPPYRYGFTPGGQYVDFFNMPTFCTTALTSFQRQGTKVSLDVDPAMQNAQKSAEAALAQCQAGDTKQKTTTAECPAAQAALAAGLGGS